MYYIYIYPFRKQFFVFRGFLYIYTYNYIHILYILLLHIYIYIPSFLEFIFFYILYIVFAVPVIFQFSNHPPRCVTAAAEWTWHPTISPTSSVGLEGSEIPEKAANEEGNKNGEVIFTVFLDVMLKNLLCLSFLAKNIWG